MTRKKDKEIINVVPVDPKGMSDEKGGIVAFEGLVELIPKEVPIEGGNFSISLLPSFIKSLLEFSNYRKAMKLNSNLQSKRIAAGKSIAEDAFAVEHDRVMINRDITLEQIGSNESIAMAKIEAKAYEQERDRQEEYRFKHRQLDHLFDELEARRKADDDKYWAKFSIHLAQWDERQKICEEAAVLCDYLQKQIIAGETELLRDYNMMLRLRINILEGCESLSSLEAFLDEVEEGR